MSRTAMRSNQQLPTPPAAFVERKQRILQQLSVPTDEYTDASPKGSIDVGIRDLIDEINALDGFVTTSSCAGRVSVFVEGVKNASAAGAVSDGQAEVGAATTTIEEAALPATLAGVGGKGGGGNWLFVSHDPVPFKAGVDDPAQVLGLSGANMSESFFEQPEADSRLMHFKFEPMILHVLTASPEHAQLLLRCGLQAGFRESGAINLTASAGETVMPMVAIRSMGLLLESLVGEQIQGQRYCTVSSGYLGRLLDISNHRFHENTKRIARFRSAVLDATSTKATKKDGTEWEDAETRRARKREEGLRRREELLREQQTRTTVGEDQVSKDSLLDPNMT
ncbi:methyltransferase TYW3-domain-containing protein [Microdochium trichocladiopsis]|uniref:tRNA(Phe) 7-[(3-amino-3-carboxypropyl)-4-demethylwyosine(37)-N(4)]-methyltransferase n=1 Tax=Microdochium trichocladiopsis TaxID=1682393 RepID=A0A9P9BXX8_9PEZI|nr:methyltransferase TYW3-domain-containing protein [Microdochium trichocladiopsis]KAH7037498.1 methyltransferase TYW3-domain-containing protein [Microdochium trichocladiopsis]